MRGKLLPCDLSPIAYVRRSEGWKVNEIASLDFPVGMTYADLTGNGYNDCESPHLSLDGTNFSFLEP
jgi:hypothetical protein